MAKSTAIAMRGIELCIFNKYPDSGASVLTVTLQIGKVNSVAELGYTIGGISVTRKLHATVGKAREVRSIAPETEFWGRARHGIYICLTARLIVSQSIDGLVRYLQHQRLELGALAWISHL